ncbi:MAG: L-2-hydroxyglutarate oxidase [Gammaproteobacteria bacterium]|nr:L-2-hydroxyglutarate oxidase [Gammaproteobacteria bacterium]
MKKTDLLVIGGGVIGLNIALAFQRRYPQQKVVLLEKETQFGAHASGRNSGVLHAGFYYTADSLKARFTREGNRLLTEYCTERGLRINRCGKLVVTRNEAELETLDVLLQRGKAGGVTMHELTEREAHDIEPRAKTFQRALFSPTTSSVDPQEVVDSMANDAKDIGIEILTGTAYLGRKGQEIRTTQGKMLAGYVINAAGLYADKVAQDFGFSEHYRIIPFKGLYLYSDEPVGALRTHIYPVPDLRNPFLGVHFTLTADGHIKVGPTAIPAFWREHYKGFENFNASELFEITMRELGLMLNNDFGFRKLAVTELSKYYRPRMVKLASTLLSGVDNKTYRRWGRPGIRAQLFDLRNRRLEQDFCFEGDQHSFHVLNAVSPAFTCSIPFCEYLIDQVEISRSR